MISPKEKAAAIVAAERQRAWDAARSGQQPDLAQHHLTEAIASAIIEADVRPALRSLLAEWLAKQGHEACWYYPEIFAEIAKILDVELKFTTPTVSRSEFACGCARFADTLYSQKVSPTCYHQ